MWGRRGLFLCTLPQKRGVPLNDGQPPPKGRFPPSSFHGAPVARRRGKRERGTHTMTRRTGSQARQAGRVRRHTASRAGWPGWAACRAVGGFGGGIPPDPSKYVHGGGGEGPQTLTSAALAAGYLAQRGQAWRNRATDRNRRNRPAGGKSGGRRKAPFGGGWSPATWRSQLNRRPPLRRGRHCAKAW